MIHQCWLAKIVGCFLQMSTGHTLYQLQTTTIKLYTCKYKKKCK